MKSVMWPLRFGVLQASQTQAIHPDTPCGSQPQQLSVLLEDQDAWRLLMEPVVAAANPETGYGLSGVRLPPAVSSRVGGSIADCGGEMTGPVATNNPLRGGEVVTQQAHNP